MVDHPLHVRQHAKHVLTEAIVTDTHFLSSHLVMDYSLLVGVDETNKQLVVGIIGLCLSPFCVRHLRCQLITFHLVFVAFYSDYIRTFTWDKKMEMYFKSNLIPGKFPLSSCTRLHAKFLFYLHVFPGKQLPTVLSPELYRSRFLEAMENYFLLVPDRWFALCSIPS